jgi:hypothetical protein
LCSIYNGILFSHKKEEILVFVTSQINLEDILQNKIGLTKKDKYYMILSICRI